ncbi:hypothetical protein ACFFK7_05550 [Pseudoalteromonas xiamenensis]|uniref:hypothetical protein n=1 Tax=Pseudoalteromonas xiamenensis TaxID=882626 RepID=UPI0035EDACAE
MFASYVKHTLVWILFGYAYLQGLSTALIMSIDAQPDPSLFKTVLFTLIYVFLVAHLITKYEKLSPFFGAVTISLSAIVLFGHYVTTILVEYSSELNLALFLTLPGATWLIGDLKSKVTSDK